MNEVNLPIKYALVPLNSETNELVAYIIVKCYFLKGSIICNLDGTMDSKCEVIECKNANLAFKNGKINEQYIEEVSCVFNDIDLAKDEQRRVNEIIIEQLVKSGQIKDLVKFKEKQEASVRSMEKLRAISEKRYTITATAEKRLIYSKE